MNKIGKAAAVVALGALVLGTAIAAQHGGKKDHKDDPKMQEARKELRAELGSWGQANILPKVRAWKSKLDGAMSAQDLATLNGLRAKAAALRKDFMAKAAAMQEARQNQDKSTMESNHDAMKSFGDQQKAIFEELKPLAVKYQSTLESIGQEAKPAMETWKQEAKDITQKWAEKNKGLLGDHAGCAGHMGGREAFGMMGGMGHGGHGEMGGKMAARFMLWDGTDIIDQMQQMAPNGDRGGMGLE
ncbi:MAG: hypothetical protein JWQ98_201 [Chlorobi bacterium]|nr:hypothetical protein [Chlorobiota bacterium]